MDGGAEYARFKKILIVKHNPFVNTILHQPCRLYKGKIRVVLTYALSIEKGVHHITIPPIVHQFKQNKQVIIHGGEHLSDKGIVILEAGKVVNLSDLSCNQKITLIAHHKTTISELGDWHILK